MTERHWSKTVADAIRDAARHRGDRNGFIFADPRQEDRGYTWGQILEAARARSAALYAEGLRKGDRVAMVVPGAEDFVLTFLGAVLGGIIPVPMYPPVALGKVESYVKNVEHIVASSGAKVLLVSKQVRPILGSVLDIGDVAKIALVESLRLDAPREGTEPAVSPDDICFLQYTSGSTSAPKGVVVTHANLDANCWGIMREALKVDPDVDRGVSWLPLYHDMGLIGFVIAPVFDTCPITFLPTMEFVKRPAYWPEMLHKHHASITFAPNFAYALTAKKVKDAELEGWDLSQVRVLGCGAEPIQPATLRGFVDRLSKAGIKGTALLPCYGMAEATLAISFAHTPDGVLKVDAVDVEAFRAGEAKPATDASQGVEVVSCGPAMVAHEVGVFDEQGSRLPDRMVGELAFRGGSVTRGYYNNPEATAAAYREGWLFTGDKGYVADGHVYVCGRIKDLVIINGRNYYPTDIEWTVNELEGVRKGSSVAFSVEPASASSEQLVIVAEWAGRERPSDEALEATRMRITEAVRSQIGLSPWRIELIGPGTVPKTSSGKLQRRKTKQQFEEGTLGQEAPTTDSMQAKAAVAKQVIRSAATIARSEVMSRLPDPVRAIFGRKKS